MQLLAHHKTFTGLGVPLVLGVSRKSFLGKILGIEKAADRDAATLALHLLLLDSGADVIRVHNVSFPAQARKLFMELGSRLIGGRRREAGGGL